MKETGAILKLWSSVSQLAFYRSLVYDCYYIKSMHIRPEKKTSFSGAQPTIFKPADPKLFVPFLLRHYVNDFKTGFHGA